MAQLIFLDTSHIHLLETERRKNPNRYSSFRDTWRNKGCILVLTLAQQSELRRYSDESRREERYHVLADLAPIRTDFTTQYPPDGPQTLVAREIIRQIIDRKLRMKGGPSAGRLHEWADPLPGLLSSHNLEVLRLPESDVLSDIINLQFDAVRFAAAADRHGRTKRQLRIKDLPGATAVGKRALNYSTEIEKGFATIREESQRGELPPVSEGLLKVLLDFARDVTTRATEAGPREMLLQLLPVARPRHELLNLTSDELVIRWVFETQVRAVARELLNASAVEEEFLTQTLELADCPGFWLWWKLRQCVKRSSSDPRASHHFDVERLSYLPYVDLLFADRQMVEFVRQIIRDESAPQRVRRLRQPVSIPSTVDALQEAVLSRNGATTETDPGG